MKYSIHLVTDGAPKGYLSVKGRMEWKTKSIAIKHARDIMACKNPPWNTMYAEIENEFGELIEVVR